MLKGDSWVADIYLRISKEDGDKPQSDSISNQRDNLLSFVQNHADITLNKIRIDDGYSGVNFNRPGFLAMMEAVKSGKVNCIIVKDLSRLGRNFIETGKYIERIFPFMGVRFIAINDDYDSAKPTTSFDNLILPVKNLMNDAYCRDISIKIRSQLEVKRKMGECIAPFAVYGYLKDPAQKNRLIIDDYSADVVRDIFKLKLEGLSAQNIAGVLNAQDVLCPLEYKRIIGSNFKTPFKRNAKATWSAGAILRILKNPVYIGTLVQGKRRTPNYKVKKVFEVLQNQWVVVQNTHEPIVSCETFESVAKILQTATRTAVNQEVVYPLSGLIVCADCKKNMVRKNNSSSQKPYIYYICSSSKQKNGCTSHIIRDNLLENAVFCAVNAYISYLLDTEQILRAIYNLPFVTNQVKKLKNRLNVKLAEVEKYTIYKMKLHENFADGIILPCDYEAFSKRYQLKQDQAQAAVNILSKEIDDIVLQNSALPQDVAFFEQNKCLQTLTRKLAVALIDQISVFEGQKICINFKFLL